MTDRMVGRAARPIRVRAQLDDVARLAGVSSPTASKILNNVPTLSVKQETRERVLEAAKTLGYEPHATARALAGARSLAIAFLVPELSNSIYALMIRGAFERARELGYTVLIAEDSEGQVADERFNRLVAAGHVDGLLIASARKGHPFIETLERNAVPHVFVNRVVPGSHRDVYMQVGESGRLAARRFAAAGHRFLGHISGPLDVETSRARSEGFLETAAELGLPRPVVVNMPAFDERAGSDGLAVLLEREPRITAVFSTSINQVVGALHRADAAGLDVPGDLSLLAYDDLPLADFLIPPVSTIAMPLIELGREAVDALLEQIEGGEPRDRIVPVLPRIVERQSIAQHAGS
ncbi:LacI family DNA-binding transcriptional regulator [Compostimonas suwonensis]|uniref:LacI family transcriptional regulator n=1 Tax=Compostimonas suwonensis TaxID=1048394 RepID=A0A2M9BBQ4_9MICO|nr:LacI family DNA-binding transcriptional regulator [Compostimonas suwonensis]PJJ55368.1 LacI family transcriptional regulator [Compostimonas suwonensis]